jgi:hypothetical protein
MPHRDLFPAAAAVFVVVVAAIAGLASPGLLALDHALTPAVAAAPSPGGVLFSSRPPAPIDPPA